MFQECNWFLFALYSLASLVVLIYMIKEKERRLGKFIWLGWTLLVMGFMVACRVIPNDPILPFFHDVVWAYGAIALIARTLYSYKVRTYGRTGTKLTDVAAILGTYSSSAAFLDSRIDYVTEAVQERRSDS